MSERGWQINFVAISRVRYFSSFAISQGVLTGGFILSLFDVPAPPGSPLRADSVATSRVPAHFAD